MVFKVANDDITTFIGSLKETSVVSSQLSNDLSKIVKNFNNTLDKTQGNLSREDFQGFTNSLTETLKDFNLDDLQIDEIAKQFETLAENGEYANVKLSDLFTTLIDGNTHGFKNVRNIIHTYNTEFEQGSDAQTAFVQAVKQSNQQLGNYLLGLKGSEAGMWQYIKQLVAAKAATIALQAASMLANAALSMGVSVIVSTVILSILLSVLFLVCSKCSIFNNVLLCILTIS